MYRDDSSASLDFEAELYEVASPRRENGAIGRVAVLLVIVWISVCSLSHFLRTRHKLASHADPFDRVVTGTIALIPVLFVPVLPLRYAVRLFFARRRRRTVTIERAGRDVKWGGRGSARGSIGELQSFLSVQTEGTRQVIFATAGMDAPFSLRVPDERTAQRLCGILGAGKSDLGTMNFPIELGGKVKPRQALKRASLVLFVAGFALVEGVAILMGPWTSFGVLLFVAPLCLPIVVYLAIVSWSALGNPPTTSLGVDASQVSLDGEILCSLKDRLTLTITEDACLEIAATQIPGGKHIIKPWQPGDLHELELIKATIEACQARAAENAPGASPPTPQP